MNIVQFVHVHNARVCCSLTSQFPGRDASTAGQQAGYQFAALVVSLAMSIIGGLLTGARTG